VAGRDPLSYRNTAQWSAWTPIAPAWTATGTDPAVNNGSILASYRRIGTFGAYRGRIVMGSGTTYGTGSWQVDLPDGWVASSVLGAQALQAGWAVYNDTGTNTREGSCYVDAAGTVLNFTSGSPWSFVGATVPFTWTTGDYLAWGITLELDYE